MPNRGLKESICTSDTLDSLTADQEVLFYRLIVNCDDFGRMDARPEIVRAKCFPLRTDKIKTKDIDLWLEALAKIQLIGMYTNGGKRYLQFCKWEKHQRVRAKDSKYPAYDDEGSQMTSFDSICPQMETHVAETRDTRHETRDTEQFNLFWDNYPRKKEKQKAFKCWIKLIKDGISPDRLILASKNYASECESKKTEEQFIKHAATFLGPNKPYEDYIDRDIGEVKNLL